MKVRWESSINDFNYTQQCDDSLSKTQQDTVAVRHLEDFQAFYKSHRVRLVHRPVPEWASSHSSRPVAAHASTDRSDSWGTCDTSLWHCRYADPPIGLWFAVRRPYWWCLDRSRSPVLAFELRTPQVLIVWEFAGCDFVPMRSTSRRRCCLERSTGRRWKFCRCWRESENKSESCSTYGRHSLQSYRAAASLCDALCHLLARLRRTYSKQLILTIVLFEKNRVPLNVLW